MRLLILFAPFTLTVAHMRLSDPPPLRAPNNPHTISPPASDADLIYPYGCCGRSIAPPCRGFLPLLSTSEGEPVAIWAAGSTQTFNLSGPPPLGGNHYGGSCQTGFSVDGGESWVVATSFEGNCPHRHGGMTADGQGFEVRVPGDIPIGTAVFAWTWNNREQEFFMSCAVVEIIGGNTVGEEERISWKERPEMLFSDIENGCMTMRETAELKYPIPGPDVVTGDGEYPLALPTGRCENTRFA